MESYSMCSPKSGFCLKSMSKIHMCFKQLWFIFIATQDSLNECTIIYQFHSTFDGHLCYLQFLTIKLMLLWTSLLVHMKYSSVEYVSRKETSSLQSISMLNLSGKG